MTESDSELLQRCRRGDEVAWRDLVARHTRRVFNLAYRFVGRVDEAEDLTQDIFVKIYQNLDRYHSGQGAFSTWLTAVGRNLAIDHHRKRREERFRRVEGEGLVENMPSADEGPQRSLEREERVTLVRSGIKALPLELREPIILCDLQGLPYEEVATVLGVPLGTVKSRLNRGRLELARRLLARQQTQARLA